MEFHVGRWEASDAFMSAKKVQFSVIGGHVEKRLKTHLLKTSDRVKSELSILTVSADFYLAEVHRVVRWKLNDDVFALTRWITPHADPSARRHCVWVATALLVFANNWRITPRSIRCHSNDEIVRSVRCNNGQSTFNVVHEEALFLTYKTADLIY